MNRTVRLAASVSLLALIVSLAGRRCTQRTPEKTKIV